MASNDFERERECEFVVLLWLVQCEMDQGGRDPGWEKKQVNGFKFVNDPFLCHVIAREFSRKHKIR